MLLLFENIKNPHIRLFSINCLRYGQNITLTIPIYDDYPYIVNTYKLNKHMESLVTYYLPNRDKLERMGYLFYLFSDKTRLRIMFGLTISEMCVGDISLTTGINRTTVSHQLTILKREGLVQSKNDGKLKIYYISNPLLTEFLKVGAKAI